MQDAEKQALSLTDNWIYVILIKLEKYSFQH